MISIEEALQIIKKNIPPPTPRECSLEDAIGRYRAMYQKAYDLATGHNPPAAFTRPAARKKLAGG